MSLQIDIIKQFKEFSLTVKLETGSESLGLLGASGCGKSLTLKCIAGIITPNRGKIVLNGRVLYDSEQRINIAPRHRNIGLLFQNYALFPTMTVSENIGIGIRGKNSKAVIIDKMLEIFRLGSLKDRYPGQLSGGEQQRVAMARILAYEPEALLLDEPFSALDSYLKAELREELKEVLQDYGKDIIMVSHSREELFCFCGTIAVIDKGKLLEFGDKHVVFTNPRNIATARLTGCRNISRAVKISEHEINALDWKLRLQTEKRVSEDIHYVGIRAHNVAPCGCGTENSIPVVLAGFTEGPHETSIVFRNKELIGEDSRICWIVASQEWNRRIEAVPEYLCLPREHLLLLT